MSVDKNQVNRRRSKRQEESNHIQLELDLDYSGRSTSANPQSKKSSFHDENLACKEKSNIFTAKNINPDKKDGEDEVRFINPNQPNEDNIQISSIISNNKTDKLVLPSTYEKTIRLVGDNLAKMAEFIVPVTQFEQQIIQVANDIDLSGYLLFLYGISGVGKSTFVSSLKWRPHIPIKEIEAINASELISLNEPGVKLARLHARLKEIAIRAKEENSPDDKARICVIIDYLENLQDEDEKKVRSFFRDLNGLLRQAPILIVWPVTEEEDLKLMRKFAASFSSTMFHRRIPVMKFTGPPLDDYPTIAKNTISFFNSGRNYYEFQLHDEDFEKLKEKFEKKPIGKHIIRDYLEEIIELWEQKTDSLSKVMQSVPKPTEVWFIICYPEAEEKVAQFAKQSPDIASEMWNADYRQLYMYARGNQREADWSSERLALAISGMLNTKILYLPTNTLVSCIAAYAEDANVPIRKEKFQSLNVPNHWFQKKQAQQTLKNSPLYRQLANAQPKKGKRRSGSVSKALDTATEAFKYINTRIVERSDQPFNKALSLALIDVFKDNTELKFDSEIKHPLLANVRPDILVEVGNSKYICIEMHYTNQKAPNIIAKYVLEKLNMYMKQVESLYKT